MRQVDENCIEYAGSERRKHCELVIIVNQKFMDFMEKTESYRDRNEKSLKELAASVDSMREEVQEIRRPYKMAVWVGSIITGVFLLEFAQWLIQFIKGKLSSG